MVNCIKIFYLIAANLLDVATGSQLLIPQVFLWSLHLLSCIFSINPLSAGIGYLWMFLCGFESGLIGQTYQTGADSYLLFLVWATLLLPCYIRPNFGVFALLCVVISLLVSVFKQLIVHKILACICGDGNLLLLLCFVFLCWSILHCVMALLYFWCWCQWFVWWITLQLTERMKVFI